MVAILLLTLLQTAATRRPRPRQPATTQAAKPRPRPAASASNLATDAVRHGRRRQARWRRHGDVDGPGRPRAEDAADGTVASHQGLRSGTYRARFATRRLQHVRARNRLACERRNRGDAHRAAPAAVTPHPPPAPPPPPPQAATRPEARPAICRRRARRRPCRCPTSSRRTSSRAASRTKRTSSAAAASARTVLWQIREPWEGRQHAAADAHALRRLAAKARIRSTGARSASRPGSFAVVPRGTQLRLHPARPQPADRAGRRSPARPAQLSNASRRKLRNTEPLKSRLSEFEESKDFRASA